MKLPLNDKKFVFLLIAVLVSMTAEILCLFDVVHFEPEPGAPILNPYSIVFAVFVLGIGYGVFAEGIKSLFKLNFGSINLLILIAVCAAFYLGEYPEAAVVTALFVFGEKLETIGIETGMSALENLVNNAPKTALVKDTGETTPIDKVNPGTIIQIKPYDLIPLDGIVESGETMVDESTITGELIPKDKSIGDSVFAGTLNKSGFIEVKTTKSANDTTYAKIIQSSYEAQNGKSNAQKFIQKFAAIYTPIVISLAVLMFVIPVFVFGLDLNDWLEKAVMLLIISCPCALVISTPVAIYAAIGNASSKGALIKGGKFLEVLGRIRAVGMDKTRTITYGKPIVSDVIPLNGTSREELLACSAGTELFSEHPLAQAIVDASTKEGFEPHSTDKFESFIGKGAKAVCKICNHSSVLVGKTNFIEQHHPVDEETKKLINELSDSGKTCVTVSCNSQIIGIIALIDEVKPESREVIDRLQKLNVEPIMLTGDNKQAAELMASSVNIKSTYSELLPQDKMDIIKELRKKYKTIAMIGDGINDAPALSEANVGIALGVSGSDTAIEISDIALMNENLMLLPFLVRLGRKTLNTIKMNTIGAIVVKILVIIATFLGYGNLFLAITADVGVTLVVILVSLRLIKFK